MEQNGKNRKPNNKPYYKKKNSSGKNSGVKNTASFDKNEKAEKKSVHSDAEALSSRKNTKKNSSVYRGSFDLVDSFESEEKKNGSKANVKDGAYSEKKRGGKIANQSGEKRRSYEGAGNADSDELIHTVPKNKYIPFEIYEDDDIIPETYDAYESFDRNDRNAGNSGKKDKGGRNGKNSKKGYNRYDDDSRDGGIPGAVVGRNAVRELLRSDRSVDKLYVKSGAREGSIVVIVAEAVSKKIPIVEVTDSKLDSLAGGSHHQGVVALAAEKQYTDIESILQIAKDRGETPLIVVADGIEDPQNLGAVIRCAECAGVHGIIIPKRRAVGLTPIVTKASAGAIEHMAIAKVSNLADAVEKLKKAGLWIFAAEAGGTPYYEADFKVPTAIVLGSEGFGVSRLIKERSDFTVSIPMYGKVNSLNVSTAASVILCHAARMQRS